MNAKELEQGHPRATSGAKQKAERTLREHGFGGEENLYREGILSSENCSYLKADGTPKDYADYARWQQERTHQSRLDKVVQTKEALDRAPQSQFYEKGGTDQEMERCGGSVPVAEPPRQGRGYAPVCPDMPQTWQTLLSMWGLEGVRLLVEIDPEGRLSSIRTIPERGL